MFVVILVVVSVGTLLTLLITQGDLVTPNQRICAYYIMYDLFQEADERGQTPFLSVFLNFRALNSPTSPSSWIERNFLCTLLNDGTSEVRVCDLSDCRSLTVIPMLFLFVVFSSFPI